MSTTESLSWADRVFGSDAALLREVIAASLAAACSQSQDAQDVSRARKKYPFGSSLWTLQFQELADRIALKMPDRHRLESLDNYSLAVVSNYVLYPVRSVNTTSVKAKDGKVRKPVSKLRRQMFSALGPKSFQPGLWPEQTAEEAAKDMRTLITRLGVDAHLAVISYVCDYTAGLQDIYWGEAELDIYDGVLAFHDGESLLLTSPAITNPAQQTGVSSSSSRRAFDGGDLPEIHLGVNTGHQTPAIEPEPPRPISDDEEE